MNKVFLYGRLGADPTPYESKRGGRVAGFSLAINEKGFAGEALPVKWIRVSALGVLAEKVLGNCFKGSQVMVVGHLDTFKTRGGSTVVQVVAEEVLMPEAPDVAAKDESPQHATEEDLAGPVQ